MTLELLPINFHLSIIENIGLTQHPGGVYIWVSRTAAASRYSGSCFPAYSGPYKQGGVSSFSSLSVISLKPPPAAMEAQTLTQAVISYLQRHTGGNNSRASGGVKLSFEAVVKRGRRDRDVISCVGWGCECIKHNADARSLHVVSLAGWTKLLLERFSIRDTESLLSKHPEAALKLSSFLHHEIFLLHKYHQQLDQKLRLNIKTHVFLVHHCFTIFVSLSKRHPELYQCNNLQEPAAKSETRRRQKTPLHLILLFLLLIFFCLSFWSYHLMRTKIHVTCHEYIITNCTSMHLSMYFCCWHHPFTV